MKKNLQYKYRIYPNSETQTILNQWIGAIRFLWNNALDQRMNFYTHFKQTTGYNISWFSQKRELTEVRKEFDWFATVPRYCLDMVLKDLDSAFQSFFRGQGGYPKFKNKGTARKSIQFQGDHKTNSRFYRNTKIIPLNTKWTYLKVAKLPPIKMKIHREIPIGRICYTTISHDALGWHATLNLEVECPELVDKGVVGIDRGVVIPVALSDGTVYHSPLQLERTQKTLKRAQQKFARCQRGSKRRENAKARVNKLAAKLARIRKNNSHTISADIAKKYSVIGIEDLNIQNISKSAKGTNENPGKNIKQKTELNRSILNASWGLLIQHLEYKTKKLIKVNPAYSSQTCSTCGYVSAKNRESQSIFHCQSCGHQENADINAAKIIKQRVNDPLLDSEGSCISTPMKSLPNQTHRLVGERNCVECQF